MESFWLAAWDVQMIKYSAFLQSRQTIGLAFCFAVLKKTVKALERNDCVSVPVVPGPLSVDLCSVPRKEVILCLWLWLQLVS